MLPYRRNNLNSTFHCTLHLQYNLIRPDVLMNISYLGAISLFANICWAFLGNNSCKLLKSFLMISYHNEVTRSIVITGLLILYLLWTVHSNCVLTKLVLKWIAYKNHSASCFFNCHSYYIHSFLFHILSVDIIIISNWIHTNIIHVVVSECIQISKKKLHKIVKQQISEITK